MWSPAIWILMLAISEPLLSLADKVVVVVPQQIRRSPAPQWRSVTPRFRKSSHESHFRRYHGPQGYYRRKRPTYADLPYPHGGDDFDQGHETVNHVRIPYGKDVGHAISFGKGYIPYEHAKGSFSFVGEKYPGDPEEPSQEPGYEATSFAVSGPEYQSGPSNSNSNSNSFELSQSGPGPLFADPETALGYDERRDKLYASRSIGKESTANSPIDLTAAIDRSKQQLLLLQQKTAELYGNAASHPRGEVILPAGIPEATIGGSKEGVVLGGSVSLDDYQQRLREMTESWPRYLLQAGSDPGLPAHGYQAQGLAQARIQQPIHGYHRAVQQQTSSPFAGSFGWPLNVAQSKKGYAVKEDTMEPPHDFRSMPIRTNPFSASQSFPPVQVNAAVPRLVHPVNG
nr:uncharacterized protein LOC117221515 isoform X1 [Megalopta genalis]XP_033328436.1 uncharacterized protein LOC117221515 isoform X2 [Megalopta genalis]